MKLEEEIHQKKFRNEYHKAFVNIIYTYNWVIEQNFQVVKPFGITLQQYNVLRILRGCSPKPATIKYIKERMLDKMSDASRIVEKLRLKDLVERNICESDRRNVDIFITEKGLKLLVQLDEKINSIENNMKNISEKEAGTLNDLLDKIRNGKK